MKILNEQELDFKVMMDLNKVPFGSNIKEFFLSHFEAEPAEYDRYFEGGNWAMLSETEQRERKSSFESHISKFDVVRKVFDK